ncbi:hypothetical protein SEPCBS119000_001246 [Sporothrix epigloea]|uniref:Uncharacterized protein n=1 Tax=Sporothrix epigloea TaxID=1892477 RepID=A0ABP0D9N2_9PEZI
MAASWSAGGGPLFALSTVDAAARPLGHRVSWRHKDSSEKTPSTAGSDGAGYIAPAVPVGSSSQSARLSYTATTSSTAVSEQLLEQVESETLRSASMPLTASGLLNLQRVLPWIQAAEAGHDGPESGHGLGSISRGPASISSLFSPPSPRRREQKIRKRGHRMSSDREAAPPVLSPLQPQYRPPTRRPTPPGVPSFEALQSPLNASFAPRRFRPGPATGDAAERKAGCCANTSIQSPSHSTQPAGKKRRDRLWRLSRALARTLDKLSQRAAAPTASCLASASSRQADPIATEDFSDSFNARFSTAEAAAELEVRNGRPPRPVTLDDYSFLQDENGTRAVRSAYIVTDEPAPVDAPVAAPVNAAAIASETRQTMASTEAAADPTCCPCAGWRIPHWLVDLFTYEEVINESRG